MSSDIKSLSDEELSELIETSRRAVSTESSNRDVDHAATGLLEGSGHSTLCVEPGSRIYRARDNDDIAGERFSMVSEIMAPEKCSLGRACLEGGRVLYAASTLETAALEIEAEEGDTVTVVELSSSRQLRLVDFGCTDRCVVPVGSKSWRIEQMFEQGLDRRGWRNQHFIRDFLVGLFTDFVDRKAPNKYRLSAEIASRLMHPHNAEHVDGIMYPSVAYLGHSWNAAIAERAFNSLTVERVLELRVISTRFFPITVFRVSGVGKADGNKIEWDADSKGLHFALPESMKGEWCDYLEVSEHEGQVSISRKSAAPDSLPPPLRAP